MVLTSTNNQCFEQKHEKISEFLSEIFFGAGLGGGGGKFSVYLNRHVFVMIDARIFRVNTVPLPFLCFVSGIV